MKTTILRYLKIGYLLVFAVFLVYFFARLIYYNYNLVIYPYPAEYREGALIQTTDAFIRGINPYDLKNQPQYTNVYGIVYPLLVYPFAKIFGATVLVHRAVSAFFAMVVCLVIFCFLRRQKIPLFINVSGILILYAGLLYPATITACSGPHTLGLFLFLLSIFLPCFLNYSWRSLMLSMALAVLAFYTKTYFILAVPYLAGYLFLFVSKKKAIVYSTVSALILAATILPMHHFFNSYFNNTFFAPGNSAGNKLSYFFTQWKDFEPNQHYLLIVLLAGSALSLVKGLVLMVKDRSGWKGRIRRGLAEIRLLDLDQPLLNKTFPLSLFCAICSFLILYFRMGRNDGSWLWYFFHLLSPFLVAGLEILKPHRLWQWLIAPLLLLNLSVITKQHDFAFHFERLALDTGGWQTIERQIALHKNILNSPMIATLLVENNKPVYDNGLSEYFKVGAYREKYQQLFPPDRPVMVRYYEFRKELSEMIRKKEFDLVILTKNYAPLVSGGLNENYRYLGEIELPLPHSIMKFTVTIWVPK